MFPNNAAPIPAIPNAKPKNKPEIAPTLPGSSSWANTRIAENAQDNTIPMMTESTPVQNNPTNGNNMVSGATLFLASSSERLQKYYLFFWTNQSQSACS